MWIAVNLHKYLHSLHPSVRAHPAEGEEGRAGAEEAVAREGAADVLVDLRGGGAAGLGGGDQVLGGGREKARVNE